MSDIKEVFNKKLKKGNHNSTTEVIAGVDTRIVTLLKNKEYISLTAALLLKLPQNKRVEYVCDIFYKGAYKSYSLGMKQFKEVIDTFLTTGHTNHFDKYKEHFYENPSIFGYIVQAILNDIKQNTSMMWSLGKITGLADMPINQVDYKKYAMELLEIVYPNNQALRVLFI